MYQLLLVFVLYRVPFSEAVLLFLGEVQIFYPGLSGILLINERSHDVKWLYRKILPKHMIIGGSLISYDLLLHFSNWMGSKFAWDSSCSIKLEKQI